MRLSQCITRAAQLAPAKTAATFGDRSRSWAEFADRVARLAGALRGLGVGAGDRVAFLGRNSDRHLEWFFAVGWAGAVFVPVNNRLARPEIQALLHDCGARVLFADDDVAFDCEHLVYAGEGAPPGARWHASCSARCGRCPASSCARATGRPKPPRS